MGAKLYMRRYILATYLLQNQDMKPSKRFSLICILMLDNKFFVNSMVKQLQI